MSEKKTISFSVTLEEHEFIRLAAIAKGLSPSGYSKHSTVNNITMHPPKGVLVELARLKAELPI